MKAAMNQPQSKRFATAVAIESREAFGLRVL